jgi:tetratricopeptide (TPR) repeat protein
MTRPHLVKHASYTIAEPLYQRALRILEQQMGPQHPDVVSPLNNLAALYAKQGKYAEAEPLFRRALRIWEQQLGPQHPATQTVRTNYAVLLRAMGREGGQRG